MRYVSAEATARSAEEVLACVYDFSDRAPRLPEQPPEVVEYAVVQEGEVFVASGLNLDIASQGDSPQHAVEMLKEAIAAYYEHQAELAAARRLPAPRLIATGALRLAHA
jgi:predicted RNase H-like HicB family nuclease